MMRVDEAAHCFVHSLACVRVLGKLQSQHLGALVTGLKRERLILVAHEYAGPTKQSRIGMAQRARENQIKPTEASGMGRTRRRNLKLRAVVQDTTDLLAAAQSLEDVWEATRPLAGHLDASRAHGLTQKGNFMYRENVGVPLVMVGLGNAGAETAELTASVDLAPTILAEFGLPTPTSMVGKNIF